MVYLMFHMFLNIFTMVGEKFELPSFKMPHIEGIFLSFFFLISSQWLNNVLNFHFIEMPKSDAFHRCFCLNMLHMVEENQDIGSLRGA